MTCPNGVTGKPMKISKLTIAAYILLPALLFLVLGWMIYPWLLDIVMAGSDVPLVSPSITALTVCQLRSALSLAWLSAVTSTCILFLKYKTAAKTVWGIASELVLTAVVSAAVWLFFIHYKTAWAIHSLAEIRILIDKGVLSVEDIPVHEAGIFASIIVVLTTVLFSFRENQKNGF